MEKDLLKEMGMIEVEDEETEDECSENASEEDKSTDESEINCVQLQVENSVRSEFMCTSKETFVNAKVNGKKDSIVKSLEDYIIEEGVKNIDINKSVKSLTSIKSYDSNEKQNEETINSVFDDTETSDVEEFSDSRSMYSNMTNTTIAPELIKKKVKIALEKRGKKEQSKRILVKGEANAVTRTRRENRDIIKQSTGIWGWE